MLVNVGGNVDVTMTPPLAGSLEVARRNHIKGEVYRAFAAVGFGVVFNYYIACHSVVLYNPD